MTGTLTVEVGGSSWTESVDGGYPEVMRAARTAARLWASRGIPLEALTLSYTYDGGSGNLLVGEALADPWGLKHWRVDFQHDRVEEAALGGVRVADIIRAATQPPYPQGDEAAFAFYADFREQIDCAIQGIEYKPRYAPLYIGPV